MEEFKSRVLTYGRVVQVVEVKYCAGRGTPEDRYREVVAYFDFDGHCIGIKDPTFSESLERRLP